MVFLIDEKLGNLALFDEISLLGITGKQKSQCTPLLQSNQCFTFMTLRSIFCHMIYKGHCAFEASLGKEQKEINVIFTRECQQWTSKAYKTCSKIQLI